MRVNRWSPFAPPATLFLRSESLAKGLRDWPEFDGEVLGGNYHGYRGKKSKTFVRAAEGACERPIMTGVGTDEFRVFGSLYETLPLAESTTTLLYGRTEDLKPHEPVAWTNRRANGGKVFYTSLGHPGDFDLPDFQKLLRNAVYWAADLTIPVGQKLGLLPKKTALAPAPSGR